MLASFREHMAERDPVFLDENLETLKRTIVWIYEELG